MPGIDRGPAISPTPRCCALDRVPEHLVVIGGSYIGLEFAQMYRRFGAGSPWSREPRLIAREDEDVSDGDPRHPRSGGHRRPDRRRMHPLRAARGGRSRSASIARRASRRSSAPIVLLAVGRRPNTDDLGLDKAGVAIDARGYITVDDQLRTSVPGHLGAGRLQRPRRLHPHRLQRFRDRRGQSARRRHAPGQRPHPRLRALSSIRRSAASA